MLSVVMLNVVVPSKLLVLPSKFILYQQVLSRTNTSVYLSTAQAKQKKSYITPMFLSHSCL